VCEGAGVEVADGLSVERPGMKPGLFIGVEVLRRGSLSGRDK